MTTKKNALIFAATLFLTLSVHAAQFKSDEELQIQAPLSDVLFAAAGELRVNATSKDDLYLAGGRIELGPKTSENLYVAGGGIFGNRFSARLAALVGGQVRIQGASARDLTIAGGSIELIQTTVEDELIAAGGRVIVDSDSRVGGTSVVTGGRVDLLGKFAQPVRVYAKEVHLGGHFSGTVITRAEELTVDSTAVIEGDLDYTASNVTISPQAVIKGKKLAHEVESKWAVVREGAIVASVVMGILFGLGFLVLAVVVALVFPTTLEQGREILWREFWPSLGKGAAFAFGGLAIWICVMVTVVGAPLALAAIPFFAVIKFLGWMTAVYAVGTWVLGRLSRKSTPAKGAKGASHLARRRALAVVIGALLSSIVMGIPIVGSLVAFGLFLAGTGAFITQFLQRTKKQL